MLGSMEGEAQPGGVARNPTTGRIYALWSQLNLDTGQETAGRVYLRTQDPQTGIWLPARSVNGPGSYKIGKSAPEAVVGVAPDGTVYVAYVRADGDNALIEWRSSTDNGMTWSPPADFPFISSNQEIYNLRMVMDAAGQPHIVGLIVNVVDPEYPSGDIVYYERLADGSWHNEQRPVGSGGDRQYAVSVSTYRQAGGVVRTILGYNEGQRVYAAYKDGPGGAWSSPVLIIDGNSHPDGIPDYSAGFGGKMAMLAFDYSGRPWVMFTWSLYSTGRICYSYSSDGGQSWSQEDALAYFPIPFATPPPINGTVHDPAPIFDPVRGLVFVVYQYCDRSGDGGCFPVYAYAPPATAGVDWTHYADPLHEPARVFRTTRFNSSDRFRSNQQPEPPGSSLDLMWRESTGQREIFFGEIYPATLLSNSNSVP